VELLRQLRLPHDTFNLSLPDPEKYAERGEGSAKTKELD
jgi:hypothetical protein